MLEIILIVTMSRKLAEIASSRGRSKGWAALGVAFWFGGELFGFILGGLFGLEGLSAYPIALGIAAIGLTVAWLVVKNLPMQTMSPT